MGISEYLKNKWLDAAFNATSFSVANVYVQLHSGDPGSAGTANVISGPARDEATFGAASGGASTTDAECVWSSMPACTVSHVSLWDASTSGNLLWTQALSAPVPVLSGDTFKILAGDLDSVVT